MFNTMHRPLRPAQRQLAAGRFKRRLLRLTLVIAATLAMTATTSPVLEAASPRMIVGAVGDASALSRSIGAPLAYHGYGKSNGSVPNATMINMKPVTSWRNVANAASGSAVYSDIVRWARTIKARPGPILFAFHHEPEASGNTGFGTANDYIAAYRRVVSIFRQQGVSNVEYTWQMTSWSFATSSSDRRYAAKWYPGDSYVTNVGTDPYNWYNCGPGQGRWESLQEVMAPSLRFARAHGKKLVVAEFASQADPARRPQWLRTVHDYFVANRESIRAVFYFHYNDPGHTDCHWKLTTSAELDAMRRMALDSVNFTAG